ncbi:hypothetical protein GUITHDRAFT_118561 [Guillardia theta CCMP2712]|uniref:DUF3456 domain-containing protein n=1 Tax=Guillardia theta (strain CCMP2712) TaxID=905079 RepID=L1IGK3_GUITC|nr:hypothetical protein GUITHDRAFT_118561 [Guillardia theta CCMP2712]EKX35217.1 hypothetical protein GUITHDRAFT_118561 [Guillardia theta CCMP2712]|eukprot:XP_005822197.1 hypothetical protein GUITHDRAFT_118561 [Guillardia theta CCMP2712]
MAHTGRGECLVTLMLAVSLALQCTAVEITQEQHENLPDYGDPKVAARLKCSACRGSAVEFHDTLRELRERRKAARIKDYEYTEALDVVCESRVDEYGLQLRNNLPTQKFSKDKSIARAHGNWAGRYIKNLCGEMYSDHEEEILRHSEEELPAFVDSMCRSVMRVCDEESISDKTLGDEEVRAKGKEL